MADITSGYIEIHFYTEDGSHSMDAESLNKCIYEYLGIIKEITSKFQVQVKVEAEALEEGGIRQWLKVNFPTKEEFKKELIMAVLISSATSPFTATISSIVDHYVQEILTPEGIRKLKEERDEAELEYQIAWYKNETRTLADTVNVNIVAKKKSNFYSSVKGCSKVKSVEFTCADEHRNNLQSTHVNRCDFDKLILASDDLEPTVVQDAIIEIVSPVLKKGKYKWTGIYNGEVIQFSLKSNEFKTLVQTGSIAFKNGTSIRGELVVKRKLDSDGNEKITGYEITTVDATFENDNPTETPEGKRKRQKKEAEKMQLSFDF